jgi:3-oxoacyl-(acyl-carrier-protein) synthase
MAKAASPPRRVCITGIGIVSPLAHEREGTWRRVVAGDCAAAPVRQFDASSWRTNFACEVLDYKLPAAAIRPQDLALLNRASEFGVGAALEAMTDSGLAGTVAGDRFGVSVGVGIGAVQPEGLAELLAGIDVELGERDLARHLETRAASQLALKNHPATFAHLLSYRWGALGPLTTINTACASSGQSLGQALLQIRRGDADAMLVGGADSLAGELYLAAFCLIGAVSARNGDPGAASRPFDRGRDGFVASEGAAMLVLEERERAVARGAKIYAELRGYGDTCNAYRVTDLPEDGRGIMAAMETAVADSGLGLEMIDYINAHGTSTPLNDRIEAMAIDRVFTARGLRPLVNSTKSETGHLISAAGALEAAFCALAVRDGVIPPSRNLAASDCSPTVAFAPRTAVRRPVRAALSNLLGFGGSNATLVIAQPAGPS